MRFERTKDVLSIAIMDHNTETRKVFIESCEVTYPDLLIYKSSTYSMLISIMYSIGYVKLLIVSLVTFY